MLKQSADKAFAALDTARLSRRATISKRPVGIVAHAGDGIARIKGLARVKSGELLKLEGGMSALALDLEHDSIGALLLDHADGLSAGVRVYATGNVVHVPVGEKVIGRVIDPLGRPLDDKGPFQATTTYPVERDATPIMERAPVSVPLQTGIKAVDALVPIGRGQRELILGDRQTGKTAIAIDTILNQKDTGVLCVYVAIGQRTAATAQVISTLKRSGAMDYTAVVVAGGDEYAGIRYIAPYAATSIAEYLMEQGKDVLIVYDDLTKHADSYREFSLVLRRPPAREAYPGDVFYAHARLLERSTRLIDERGGGSLTALPIAETQAEDMSAYIPTNLISITDGQIYLSTELFQRGIRPAVDVGKSVSRVGGKSQIAAYRQVASRLKLNYSQFEELEFFSRLGTRLDRVSEQIIRRGQRIREVLKQPPGMPISVGEQVVLLMALNEGYFDGIDTSKVGRTEAVLREHLRQEAAIQLERLERGRLLSDEGWEYVFDIARRVVTGGQKTVKG